MFISPQIFASELLKRPVLDSREAYLGASDDLVITPGERFPRVVALTIRAPDQKVRILPIEEIEMLRKDAIIANQPAGKLAYAKKVDGAIYLNRDLLDKQIVDTHGFKVVRVNDLKLVKIGEDLRVLAADVGLAGILRRLWFGTWLAKLGAFLPHLIPETLISWHYVQPLETDLEQLKLTVPLSLRKIRKLHPAEVADVISQVRRDEKFALFNILEPAQAAEALHELDFESQIAIIKHLPAFKAADIFEIMPPDEAVDLLGDLPPEKSQELLEMMDKKESGKLKSLLEYDEKSAGGLMTTEFISVPEMATVAEALEILKKASAEAEIIYYLYVVDEQNVLKGVVSLRQLLAAPDPAQKITDIMNDKVIHIHPQQSQKKAAEVISKYNFLALPVVDLQSKLIGIITFDDILNVLVPTKKKKERLV